MKVIKWLELQKHYLKEAEKARLEMIEAIQDRDKVFSEIKEQRNWLNIIKKEINELENIYNQKNIDYKWLEHDLNNERDTLEKNIYKHIETSKQVSLSLHKWEEELEKIKKEIEKYKIDLKRLKELKKQEKYLQNEIQKLKHHKSLYELELDEREKWMDMERKILDDSKKEFSKQVNELQKKEKKLNLKEKRLNELEQSLFSKK